MSRNTEPQVRGLMDDRKPSVDSSTGPGLGCKDGCEQDCPSVRKAWGLSQVKSEGKSRQGEWKTWWAAADPL